MPTDEDFKKIIKEYTELKFKIIRDEIFRIYKLLLDYAEPVEHNSFSPNDIKNAIFLLESGLLKDKSTFTIFSDFFRESKSYSEAVETIKTEIMNFDDKLRDTLINYLAKNSYSNSPLNRISVVV